MPRFMITGGGTGGHIFPAIAIADALKRRFNNCEILFVGAEGRMEMERVPQAGYPIKAIPISGLDRKNLLRNIGVIIKFIKGIKLAKRYIQDFEPDVVIGVGGYVSAPTVLTAQNMGIPTLIQEQNSYAGVANKRLATKANAVCVAYQGMDRFFPANKIVLTGNPIRENIEKLPLPIRSEALERFGVTDVMRPTVVSVGGSLGALTINESLADGLKKIAEAGITLIWQTGKSYQKKAQIASEQLPTNLREHIIIVPFIDDMASAYSCADLLISRAGASTISEIQCLGQPTILVPSPNVAEDHQTHNAQALVNKNAAEMIVDANARTCLVDAAIALVTNKTKLSELGNNAHSMHLPNSADHIIDIISGLLKEK